MVLFGSSALQFERKLWRRYQIWIAMIISKPLD